VVYVAWKLSLGLGHARPLNLEVWGVKLGLGIVKQGAVCVYFYPYMVVIACCGIRRLGAEPSIVI
jgi:hypothetical protein